LSKAYGEKMSVECDCTGCTIEVVFDNSTKVEDIERLKKLILILPGIRSFKFTPAEKRVGEPANISERLSVEEKLINTNLFTVKQMAKRHSAFNENALRALIYSARNNRFEQCVRRVGRRVILVEDEFLKWVDSNPTKKIDYSTHDKQKYGR
jgi:hypothetical protein